MEILICLAKGGYKDITVFDRCQFDKSHYNPADGCDGASADINKIFRFGWVASVLPNYSLKCEQLNMVGSKRRQIKSTLVR